ncbi:hypothetical protein AYL99_09127 [Fonsecaea erecta]|uniref:Uncharacterized protein n=1 Tax=Fonsecaea erecta TaxID=1367422 RepID=A0A178ZD63_9EURO|nr:hypothetical protein AYL99_09127 [Fonsecaea erecta]OAP57015.1 hypothetical protein AYL99_09127 [Fonsecaea erecta]
MACYVPAQAQDNVQALIANVKTLTVEKLKNVLRSEGLPVSGVKSELQIRTIAYIEKLRNGADIPALNRLRAMIRGVSHPYQNGNTFNSHYSNHAPTSSASPQFSTLNAGNSYNMTSRHEPGPRQLAFSPTPFYTIFSPLTSPLECKARESSRDTARVIVHLPQWTMDQLHKDPLFRVMVFCAAEPLASDRDPHHLYRNNIYDIAFPHNVELKCNGQEVKANLKGLKGKPGSTRPADITSFIKKKPVGHSHTVEMIYALTTKSFYIVVNLVLLKPIDAMVADIRRGRMITKEQTIREMRRKAEDPDEVVATSMLLSLKDPVGYTRITTPCRGLGCHHLQCFDATLYLQLQEQAPTWICPICSRPAPYDQLALDQFVNDILNLTPKSVEAVIVEPDGRWHIKNENENLSRTSNPTPSDDDDGDDAEEEEDEDGDLVEITGGSSLRPLKLETLTPHSVKTPPLSSREVSTAPPASKSSAQGKKRPREVIDLTLSDDEEEEDGSASKAPRVSQAYPPANAPGSRRVYFQPFPPSQPSSYDFNRFNPSL